MIVRLAARRSFVMVASVVATVSLGACTGGGEIVTRDDLANALEQDDTGPLDEEMARCVAGELLDKGLSEDEQREYVEEDKPDPGTIDDYNDALSACETEFGGG